MQMILIYNAVLNGWTVKKSDISNDIFEFKIKKINDKLNNNNNDKIINNYIRRFLHYNFSLDRLKN